MRPAYKTGGLCLLAGIFCCARAMQDEVTAADEALLARACMEAGLVQPCNAGKPWKVEQLPPERIVRDFPEGLLPNPTVYLGEDGGAEPVFFLMGDSHSNHLRTGLHEAATAHQWRGIALNNSVTPVWYYEPTGRLRFDARWNKPIAVSIMDYLEGHPSIRYVIISLSWRRAEMDAMDWNTRRTLPTQDNIRNFMNGLTETCNRLNAMGKKVIIIAETPCFSKIGPYVAWSRRVKLTGHGDRQTSYITPEMYTRLSGRWNEMLAPLQNDGTVRAVLDTAPCLMELTPQGCPSIYNNSFLFIDTNHFTPEASRIVGMYIIQHLLQIEQEDAAAQ